MESNTIIKTMQQARATTHVEGVRFLCGDCGKVKPVQTTGGTGYGYFEEGDDAKTICYECCGKRDVRAMRETGETVLYLTTDKDGNGCTVTNWPGTLSLRGGYSKGQHNIAGTRYDVWFVFDGWQWHGVTYGDNTQICRCKRTKRKA